MSPGGDSDAVLAAAIEARGWGAPGALAAALGEARAGGTSLAEVLLQRGLLSPDQLAEVYRHLPSSGAGPLHLGEVVAGRYRVDATLGVGGMGAVYRVRELGAQRDLALKVILPSCADELDLRRFAREAEVAARLSGAGGFVAVHSGGEHRGLPYFVMDFVEGADLEAALAGGLSERALAEALALAAEALQSAHDAGLIHRDLKPANVLLGPVGPLIADLGLVRDRDAEALTQSGEILGTPAYMAPEQILDARQVGPQTDVYALGAILYRGLAGQAPFSGPWIQVLHQVVEREPPRPSQVRGQSPSPFEPICLSAMAKDPARRYPDAAALAADLRRVLEGEAALQPGLRAPRSAPLVALVLVVAAGLLVAGGAWAAGRRPPPQSPEVAAPSPVGPAPEELARLRQDLDELLSFRPRRAVSTPSRSARVLQRALAAGLGEAELRELKRERWLAVAPVWSRSLSELARDPRGDPAASLAGLIEVLQAPPALSEGVAEVSSGALLLLSRDPAQTSRAIELQVERIALGLPAPRVLQERAWRRFQQEVEGYVDCLRLDVPVQHGATCYRLRQLVRTYPTRVPRGQLEAFLALAVVCPRDWPSEDTPSRRESLGQILELARRVPEGRADLGRRYVLEARFLEFKARTTLRYWDAREAGSRSGAEVLEQAEEARRLAAEQTNPALCLELVKLEAELLEALERPAAEVAAWERGVARIEALALDPTLGDCPAYYLSGAYRGLGYAQLEAGSPRAALAASGRSAALAVVVQRALKGLGGQADVSRTVIERKSALLAARAHLRLDQLEEAEAELGPHVSLPAFETNHVLGEFAVRIAIRRGDRPAAEARLELFAKLEDEAERLASLRAKFRRAFGD